VVLMMCRCANTKETVHRLIYIVFSTAVYRYVATRLGNSGPDNPFQKPADSSVRCVCVCVCVCVCACVCVCDLSLVRIPIMYNIV
jgi:hypothetical protein